ncbi:hypothetical protein Vwe01_06960 [Micromonospora andamanensis]|nr:hypothetical protein Vwe01_06960 [Micromonospora andamanensis]
MGRPVLERLDKFGPVTHLASWKQMTSGIDAVTSKWKALEQGHLAHQGGRARAQLSAQSPVIPVDSKSPNSAPRNGFAR